MADSNPRRELTQHRQTDALTLLRVKLRRHDIVGRNRRAERSRIIRFRRDQFRVARGGIVGVDEVHRIAVAGLAQGTDALLDSQLVPAHVRDLQTSNVGKSHHLAGKHAKTAILTVLVTDIKEQLQSQTDAEALLPATDVLADRISESAVV